MDEPLKRFEPDPNHKRKNFSIASIEPRNKTEKIFRDTFGTVVPIPDKTMHRKHSFRVGAILYIHHNMETPTIAKLVGVSVDRLRGVSIEDDWDGYQQKLIQSAKPSKLSSIVNHDIELIEEEERRRMKKLPALRKEEDRLLDKLVKCEAGSSTYSRLLASLRSIREVIAETTGLNSFLSEQSSARRAALSQFAKNDGIPEAPPTKSPIKRDGSILEI